MFTSRLPVSTKIRRPGSNVEGSTSMVGLNRPSNIPTTVRKANLFTPQTKRPLSMGASTAGKSYMSTGKATAKKYQRPLKPLPDKDLQNKMFDNLIEFLTTNGYQYPPPDAKKFFSSVSTTESSRIFEFMIAHLLPDFKINRLETDVPEALTQLDYPYIRSVTKSALVSVTTRQASVGLLVIFHWLIDMINQLNMAPEDIFDQDVDLLDVTAQLKKNFIFLPRDQLEEANMKLFQSLYKTQDLTSKLNDLEKLKEEYEQLYQEVQSLEELKQEEIVLDQDILSCKEYIVEIQKYKEVKLAELDKMKSTLARIDLLNEDRARKRDGILSEINNHPLTLEEAKGYLAKAEALRSRIIERNQKNLMAKEKDSEARIEHYLNYTRPRRLETINRLEREIESEDHKFKEEISNLERQTKEQYLRYYETKEKCDKELEELENKKKHAQKSLEKDDKELQTESDLCYKYLKIVLERNKERVQELVRVHKYRLEGWEKVRRAGEENHRVVNQALRKLTRLRGTS